MDFLITFEQNHPNSRPSLTLGPATCKQKTPQAPAGNAVAGQPECTDEPRAPEPEQPTRADDELVKQEMLVQYLQDAYSFSRKITEAIGVISKMMYENTSTGAAGPLRGLGLGGRPSPVCFSMVICFFPRPVLLYLLLSGPLVACVV